MQKILFFFSVIAILSSCGGENESNLSQLNDDGPVNRGKTEQTIEGVNIPKTLSMDSTVLTLNGTGVRNKFHLKVYLASLYLTEKSSDPQKIINDDQPQAIVLDMTSILMTSSNMNHYINEAFIKSTKGNTAPIQESIDLVFSVFNAEPVNKGDKYEIFYIPNEGGIKAYKNGKFITFFGADINFKKIVWGIWMGEDAVDEGLKAGILGLEEDTSSL